MRPAPTDLDKAGPHSVQGYQPRLSASQPLLAWQAQDHEAFSFRGSFGPYPQGRPARAGQPEEKQEDPWQWKAPLSRSRAHALRLAKQMVAAILTDGHKAVLSAMAVSRDEPNLLEQFLVLCEEAGLLSQGDCDQLDDASVEARRARAAW